jgi:F0F1-type ATP synthase assembly protein I
MFGIPVLSYFGVLLWEGGLWLWGLADRLIPPGAPGQNLNTGARDAYLSLLVFGLGLATALSLIYCLWNRRPARKGVVGSYFIFLVMLMSMSTANFARGDELLNRKAQALIDLVLVTLGLIVVIELLQFRTNSTPGMVLRGIISFSSLSCRGHATRNNHANNNHAAAN